ncbi:MAG: hypothetical protein NXY57DRAFT_1043676 [Lentinula lateritia]|nr:MAG: hypothetical protein NXY57DRAFT_1043676 [Lentinula lateritia]
MVRLAFSLLFTKRMAGRPFAMHGSFEEDVMCSACDVHVLRCGASFPVPIRLIQVTRCLVTLARDDNASILLLPPSTLHNMLEAVRRSSRQAMSRLSELFPIIKSLKLNPSKIDVLAPRELQLESVTKRQRRSD